MPRVLILCVHRRNRAPGQRFRFEQYLDFLESQGFQFDFSHLFSPEQDKAFYSSGNLRVKAWTVIQGVWRRFWELFKWRRYDLVFVQREGQIVGLDFSEKFFARRLPLIYDFDDSIWLQNVSEGNRMFGFLKRPSKTRDLIKVAALVLAGNRYLANFAQQYSSRVEVVPTTIDTQEYQPRTWSKPPGSPICVGWSGSFSTIEHFKVAIPVLLELKQRLGSRVTFRVIGDDKYICPELDVRGLPWKAATEVADLQEIDIGIMPLPDDEWSRGKCGLKGLQYMALGIPTLMSPVGVNSDIIEHGVNGYVPGSQAEWLDCLLHLVDSAEERQRLGAAGRQTVVERYSVEAWRQRYLDLFRRALSTGPVG